MLLKTKYTTSHRTHLYPWIKLLSWQGRVSLQRKFVHSLKLENQFAFVCGCGHSGTTLTAAKLGNHSKILLIGRESGIFLPFNSLSCAKNIINEWDFFATSIDCSVVVEKTPKHILTTRSIFRLIPDAKLLITIRNPLDNIASLYKRFRHLNACTDRWIADNQAALRLSDNSNVMIVQYEKLTEEPGVSLRLAAKFLGIEWEEHIISAGRSAYETADVSGNMALRVAQVSKAIRPNNGGWTKTLRPDEARFVIDKTSSTAMHLGYDLESTLAQQQLSPA